MTISEAQPAPTVAGAISWGPIVAGALSAAALALLLHAFAATVGVSTSSTAPTWRDASIALILLSGFYLILVAVVTYGVGGYLAGRLRWAAAAPADEVEFRDGVHGLAVWALATLMTAFLALSASQALTRLSAPSAGASGPATSVASENIIAYDLDRLFRGDRQETDITYHRAEAGRILLTASSHRGMLPEDRTYLVRLVAARTGLNEAEAARRVDDVIARARENLQRARRSTAILGFMAGAAALLGALAAWFAATAGGRHRDGAPVPRWMATSGTAPRRR